jgi:leucyl-tRNA synthetase
MWTKALYDLGYIGYDEPYKRLVNQGMIQGSSRFVYRLTHKAHLLGADTEPIVEDSRSTVWYIIPLLNADGSIGNIECQTIFHMPSAELYYSADYVEKIKNNEGWDENYEFVPIHVDVNFVDGMVLDVSRLCDNYKLKYNESVFIDEAIGYRYLNGGAYINLKTGFSSDYSFTTVAAVEKMSKSKFNTVNPDELVWNYGADTFRMYEMFLGPVEMSKPWDTKGIEGVHRFLKKLWRLFHDELKGRVWTDEQPSEAELKVLHKSIKQIEEVTERFSFNTGVSGFMIAVNELTDLKCHKKAILEKLLILLSPYAPHIAEELWSQLGNSTSILNESYPVYDPKYLIESSKEYPVSINGKMRTTIDIALGIPEEEVEKIVLGNEVVKKWLEGKQPKKIIYKEGKMVNVVV